MNKSQGSNHLLLESKEAIAISGQDSEMTITLKIIPGIVPTFGNQFLIAWATGIAVTSLNQGSLLIFGQGRALERGGVPEGGET